MRSRSGPLIFSRYLLRLVGSDALWPDWVGFMAATSMNLAGNLMEEWTRATVTSPDSRGWRSISKTYRENSGSSSKKRTPWWARETSPGLGMVPPPTSDWAVAEWWGVRTGRWSMRA